MSTVQFEVIDVNCEATNQSFFPPGIALTGKSVTKIATVLGFSEYPGFASTPPKKYRRITWTGSAEQTVFGGTTQVAGAKLDWTGASEIDLTGAYISTYVKNLSEMCTAADSLCPGLAGGNAPNVAVAAYRLRGWIGSAGHTKCPGTGIPYTPVGDVAIKQGQPATYDAAVQQQLSSGMVFGANGTFVAYGDSFVASSATFASDVSSGQQDGLLVATDPLPCGTLVLFGDYDHPPLGFGVSLLWNNNYSATLDEEYTDADALTQAVTINGNGTVAQNFPRTTGFVSSFTTVAFTVTCSNLITGQNYTASVDLADLTAGTVTTVQYPFTAGAATNVINDTIPTPPSGHSVVVRNPRILFV